MRDFLRNAIHEACKMYEIGNKGTSRNGFILKIHPETTYILRETPEFWIDFNTENLEKHWTNCLIEEDPSIVIGHFTLKIKN